jgi:hypothetical protein
MMRSACGQVTVRNTCAREAEREPASFCPLPTAMMPARTISLTDRPPRSAQAEQRRLRHAEADAEQRQAGVDDQQLHQQRRAAEDPAIEGAARPETARLPTAASAPARCRARARRPARPRSATASSARLPAGRVEEVVEEPLPGPDMDALRGDEEALPRIERGRRSLRADHLEGAGPCSRRSGRTAPSGCHPPHLGQHLRHLVRQRARAEGEARRASGTARAARAGIRRAGRIPRPPRRSRSPPPPGPARSAWKATAKLSKVRMLSGRSPRLQHRADLARRRLLEAADLDADGPPARSDAADVERVAARGEIATAWFS